MTVAYIDIRFFAHATEDPERVLEAVQCLIPTECFEDIRLKKSTLKGHYGNPIILFEAKVRSKRVIEAVMRRISTGLDEYDKRELRRRFSAYVERGNLYLRLDKQAAYQGRIRLCPSDPIRLRIHFKRSRLEDVMKECQELGILPPE